MKVFRDTPIATTLGILILIELSVLGIFHTVVAQLPANAAFPLEAACLASFALFIFFAYCNLRYRSIEERALLCFFAVATPVFLRHVFGGGGLSVASWDFLIYGFPAILLIGNIARIARRNVEGEPW